MQARQQWSNKLKEEKELNCQLRTIYPMKMSFQNEGKKNTFSDKQKQGIYCQQTWHKRNVNGKLFRQKDFD